MNFTRLSRLLWLGAVLVFVTDALYPISTGLTRAAGLALFLALWFGSLWLGWRRRGLRWALLGATGLLTFLLVGPARQLPEPDTLRRDYVAGMRRYAGTTYIWGGESPFGIDCSGLIRRGLVDSLFCRGLRTFNPGLVRRALQLWWHDRSAGDLGDARAGGPTVPLFDAPSLNGLDHSRLLPGDLAVTRSGVHVLAYVGGDTWIEADMEKGRVISVTAPARENSWFDTPMRLVRWEVFAR